MLGASDVRDEFASLFTKPFDEVLFGSCLTVVAAAAAGDFAMVELGSAALPLDLDVAGCE